MGILLNWKFIKHQVQQGRVETHRVQLKQEINKTTKVLLFVLEIIILEIVVSLNISTTKR